MKKRITTANQCHLGMLLIDGTGHYGFVIHAIDLEAEVTHSSNCVDLTTGKVSNTCEGADMVNVRTATSSEHRAYYTALMKCGAGVPNKHYRGRDRIKAGTVIVVNERYIYTLLNDINPMGSKEPCSIMNVRDADGWKPVSLSAQHFESTRIATEAERQIYFEYWKEASDASAAKYKAEHPE